MAALHKLLAGYDPPVLHDPGDELTAAAHVQGTQALRNRMLTDPVSRSFIGDHAAPSAGAREFAALIAAKGNGACAGDADHAGPSRKGSFQCNNRVSEPPGWKRGEEARREFR